MINIPKPNDQLDGGTVVATCHYGDDRLLTLSLMPGPPYFRVGAIWIDGNTWDESYSRHMNIVTAVREYENNGGDI